MQQGSKANPDAKEQQQQLTGANTSSATRLAGISQAFVASSQKLEQHLVEAQAVVKQARADAQQQHEQEEVLADIASHKTSLAVRLAVLHGKVIAIALISWACWSVCVIDGGLQSVLSVMFLEEQQCWQRPFHAISHYVHRITAKHSVLHCIA